MNKNFSRRQFLTKTLTVSAGLAAASIAGAGCTPKPAAEPTANASTAPSQPTAAPKAAEVITLRVQMEGGALGEQMGILLDQWNEAHPTVQAVVEETVYAEIAMKTEMGVATGDLADSLFAFTRWHWLGAYKGWYLALDDMLDAGLVPDYDDYYEIGVENQKFEGGTYGLLDSVHVGPASTITWNRGLFEKAGLEPPNPAMNLIDLFELARKVANPDAGIYGIQMALHTPGRFVNTVRSWGKPEYHAQGDISTWITDAEGKKYNLLDNPGAKELLTNYVKPLLDERVHPMPEDQVSGGLFVAGQVAMLQAHQGQPMRTQAGVGDAWEFHTEDCMILPVGPEGRQGSSWESHNRCVYANTKYPQEVLQLNAYLTGYEAGMISLGITGNRSGRKSVIRDPKWKEEFPIYEALDRVLTSGTVEKYPMPWNFRDVEANDTHKNLVVPIVDGAADWDAQAPIAQKEMQALFDLPRP